MCAAALVLRLLNLSQRHRAFAAMATCWCEPGPLNSWGLNGLGDPVPVIEEALYASEDGVEALLILNSLVLLMDGPLCL